MCESVNTPISPVMYAYPCRTRLKGFHPLHCVDSRAFGVNRHCCLCDMESEEDGRQDVDDCQNVSFG